MVSSKKSRRFNTIMIAVGIIVLLFGLSFLLLYVTNRPNYRDLEKEYSRLEIPSDWQKVGESNNKGAGGLFCVQIEGSECPHMIKWFTVPEPIDKDINEILQNLKKMVTDNNFKLVRDSYQKCDKQSFSDYSYVCSASGYSNDIRLNISLRGKNPQAKNGHWGFISISKNEE